MPSTSAAQAKLMNIAAHTNGGYGGVTQSVGEDFHAADKRVGKYFVEHRALGGQLGGGDMPRVGAHLGELGAGGMHLGHHEPMIHTGMHMSNRMGRGELAFGGLTNPFPPAHHVEAALRLTSTQERRGKLADGGTYMPPRPGFGEMADFRSILSPTAGGVIASEIPGRTDHIPTSVAANSYVIPADVVSGIGEGNTMAGARAVQEWMSKGPFGTPLHQPRGRNTIPRPPSGAGIAAIEGGGTGYGGGRTTTTFKPTMAKGGEVPPTPKAPLKVADIKDKDIPGEVPIIVAGGEMIIDPHIIAHHPDLGALPIDNKNPQAYQRALDHGHKVLDAWIKLERKKHIATLKKLPGPKR